MLLEITTTITTAAVSHQPPLAIPNQLSCSDQATSKSLVYSDHFSASTNQSAVSPKCQAQPFQMTNRPPLTGSIGLGDPNVGNSWEQPPNCLNRPFAGVLSTAYECRSPHSCTLFQIRNNFDRHECMENESGLVSCTPHHDNSVSPDTSCQHVHTTAVQSTSVRTLVDTPVLTATHLHSSAYESIGGPISYPRLNVETSSTDGGNKRNFRRKATECHKSQPRQYHNFLFPVAFLKKSDCIKSVHSENFPIARPLFPHLRPSFSTGFMAVQPRTTTVASDGNLTNLQNPWNHESKERRSSSVDLYVQQQSLTSPLPQHQQQLQQRQTPTDGAAPATILSSSLPQDEGIPTETSSAWVDTDLYQTNRALSTPVVNHDPSRQQLVSVDYPLTTHPSQRRLNGQATRSRSHHLLLSSNSISSSVGKANTDPSARPSSVSTGQSTPKTADEVVQIYSSPSRKLEEWRSGVVQENQKCSLPDRFYRRNRNGSDSLGQHIIKHTRSPITVLASCKGKLRVNIESRNGVITLTFTVQVPVESVLPYPQSVQLNSLLPYFKVLTPDCNFRIFSPKVIEAKGLHSNSEAPCNSFIKVNVIPDKNNIFTRTTPVLEASSTPVYNQTFTFDVSKSKHSKRIVISVYSQRATDTEHEFLGGMSFGIAGLHTKRQVTGWYYLLNETMTRKKHLKVATEVTSALDNTTAVSTSVPNHAKCPALEAPIYGHQVPASASSEILNTPVPLSPLPIQSLLGGANECSPPTRNNLPVNSVNGMKGSPQPPGSFRSPSSLIPLPSVSTSIPKTNQALNDMQLIQFILSKGPKGFGFTLSGGCPVYVSQVEQGSPAMQTGLQAGDFIVAVNQLNVSRSSTDSVVRMFRAAQNPVYLTVCRPINVCVKTQGVNHRNCRTNAFANFFHRGCLSQPKKSTSNESVRPEAASFVNRNATLQFSPLTTPSVPSPLSTQSFTPTLPLVSTVAQTTNGPVTLFNSSLSNSRSLYQLSPIPPPYSSPYSQTGIRNSKTESRLCDINSYGFRHNRRSLDGGPSPVLPLNLHRPSALNHSGGLRMPKVWGSSTFDEKMIPRPYLEMRRQNNSLSRVQGYTNPTLSSEPTSDLSTPSDVQPNALLSPMIGGGLPSILSAKLQTRTSALLETGQPITDSIKYVRHVKPVDFTQHSPRLEHYGCMNLLESNCCSKVDLLMFSDLLLIAQRAPNHFFTVIKDPIYNTKICYVNIPAYASDQLILQYIDDSNHKQIVHFQGPNVRDWLTWIQGHMVYNGNWWMNNITSPFQF
ncbi:unnamed protein product [Calicophoron daubneyi]|uniref:Uncharacterized protein n=1 Tax=Calicophoron daubneyi TaxID=300641 RepID=A0AAV2T192_CALDB